MAFSAKQVQALRRNLDQRFIRTREANGRELSYVEGWYVISQANRIFGFHAWSRETIDSKCVMGRENRGAFAAIYTAKVRITVQVDGAAVIREGHGTGEGRSSSPGEAHDVGLKTAETDATKRALATFGNAFGLALYSKKKRALSAGAEAPHPSHQPAPRTGLPPDDTTPIPRPSRYYGRRQDLVTQDRKQGRRKLEAQAPENTSLVPTPSEMVPGRIDKSALTISEPKRLRDKTHLRFVSSQPCLICRHQPSDAHHLRFAQPRALGLKVSDEFTVPLCRHHHQQLHQAGNELAWWHNVDIKPLEIAKALWTETHSNQNEKETEKP